MNTKTVRNLCLLALPILWGCTGSPTSAKQVVEFGHPIACEEESKRILAEVQSDLNESPRDEDIILAAVFDALVCQSEKRTFVDADPALAAEYIIPGNRFEGSLIAGMSGAMFENRTSDFWIYVFSNGLDITNEVFTNGNTVSIEHGVAFSIPFKLASPAGQATVFDFLFLDSQLYQNKQLHRNSQMTRLVVHPNESISQYPVFEYANSLPAEAATTADALIATPPKVEGGVFETSLLTTDAKQNVSFLPVKLDSGDTVKIDCDQDQLRSFITSGVYTDSRSVVMCHFPDPVDISILGAFVINDLFATDEQGRFFDSGLLPREYQLFFL